MSSLRLDLAHDERPADDGWIDIRSPREDEVPDSAARGVILSLRAHREALGRRPRPTLVVEVPDDDASLDELERDIAKDVDARWDD